jgi:hypothetical protein
MPFNSLLVLGLSRTLFAGSPPDRVPSTVRGWHLIDFNTTEIYDAKSEKEYRLGIIGSGGLRKLIAGGGR